MSTRLKLTLLALCGLVSTACAAPHHYLGPPSPADDQRRIWIVHDDEVYRCADGGSVNEPPKPVCVRASKVDD